jgi:signal transduction histidine kinase/ActR/RegA family two-component response regulator
MTTSPDGTPGPGEGGESARFASDTAHRLLEVTGELCRALTAEEVGTIAVDQGLRATGARSVALYMVDEQGKQARLARICSPHTALYQGHEVIPLDRTLPMADALLSGQPVFVESRADWAGRYPVSEARTRPPRALAEMAFACLPLVVEGRAIAGLALSFPGPRPFDDCDRDFLVVFARHCAQALGRALLLESERAARTEAEKANRVKDTFLAILSHELRTPLNAILGWVSMLRSEQVPAERRAHALEVIERNARAQEKLIADLLDMSRVSSGRLRLSVAPVELHVVVAMALEAVRPAAKSRGVLLESSIDERSGRIAGDTDRLEQITLNLVTNAVKFTPPGGKVTVSLACERAAVVLRVKDTGQGIRGDLVPNLFEPFRQADSRTARKTGGLGLGLALTRTLVGLHGGEIAVHSEGEGHGAEFTVRFPAADARGDALPRVPVMREHGPATPREGVVLAGVRVLVVEDEPDSRELLTSLLEQHGAEVTVTASAREAFECFRDVAPQLVVSDLGLPGEDGLSLMRRLRATPQGGSFGAIALSAFASAEDRERALGAGFDIHAPKPIEPDALVKALVRLRRERPAA